MSDLISLLVSKCRYCCGVICLCTWPILSKSAILQAERTVLHAFKILMPSVFFTLTPFPYLLGHAPAGPHKWPGVSITEGKEAATWTCQQGTAWCAKAAASKLDCTDFKHFRHHTCSPPLCVTLLCALCSVFYVPICVASVLCRKLW